MKIVFIFIVLTLQGYEALSAKRKSKYSNKVAYSYEQRYFENNWSDFNIYPKPKLSSKDMLYKVVSKIKYPELGKKNFINKLQWVTITIDTSGQIVAYHVLSKKHYNSERLFEKRKADNTKGNTYRTYTRGYFSSAIHDNFVNQLNFNINHDIIEETTPSPIFDSSTVALIHSMDSLWQCGTYNGKKKEFTIHFPIYYFVNYCDDIAYYCVRAFYNFPAIRLDSTRTFPAHVVTQGDVTDAFEIEFRIPHSLDVHSHFAHVSATIDVDEVGRISNIAILDSYTKEVDDEAIKQLLQKKWKPAVKDGLPISSTRRIDMMYYNAMLTTDYQIISQEATMEVTICKYAKEAYQNALQLFKQQDYTNSLHHFLKVESFYYNDPELFFNMGVTKLYMNNIESACKDLIKSKQLCEEVGYPYGINAQKIDDVLNQYCLQEN